MQPESEHSSSPDKPGHNSDHGSTQPPALTSTHFTRFSRIPSLPTIAVEALKLFHEPNSTQEQLISLIRKDPAIVSKILKAANSAKHGIRRKVTDLNQAVILIGRTVATTLVLSFTLSKQSMEASEHLEHYRRFWLRSFVQATAAEVLASQFGSAAFSSECYTTSLLCGLGKLSMLKAEPEKYLQCLRDVHLTKRSPISVEHEKFGFHHFQLSAFLLQQMGLPERCCVAIGSVADASLCSLPADGSNHPLLEVTRIADAVASLICDDHSAVALIQLEESLSSIRLPRQMTVEEVINLVSNRLQASAPLFEIDPIRLPSTGDLLQDALDQLYRLADMADEPEQIQSVPLELLEENGRLKRRVADLLYLSRMDSLTGISNRAYLLQELLERASIHRARELSLGLAVIDIDHFKQVNDTHGHQAGDFALKSVADTLNRVLRDSDMVGRYGGEEFVAILEDANPAGLVVVGERLRSSVEATPIEFEGQPIRVTVSIGLAEGRVGGDERDFCERLFAAADAAMYQAKNSGRNRCIVHALSSDTNETPRIERRRMEPESASR